MEERGRWVGVEDKDRGKDDGLVLKIRMKGGKEIG